MPYIKEEDRPVYDININNLCDLLSKIPQEAKSGHLNYIITKLIKGTNPKRYNDYNSLIGMLECCKLELYRRKIALYEDIKIEENGDVY